MNVQVVRSVLRRSTLLSRHLWSTSGNGAAAFTSLSGLLSLPRNDDTRMTHHRALSTDDNGHHDASQILSDLLARELSEEEENESASMPPELVELKAQIESDWRIVEGMGSSEDDGATVKLFSKNASGGGKVSVVFHCQDTVENEGSDDFLEEEPAVAVRFTVLITKAGKTMVLTCVSEEAEARVETVAMTDADAETVTSSGIDSELYQGPEYAELAEDVQEAFNAFVQTECGIDSDVAAFISMYSDYKEQTEYVRWLKQVRSMLS